MAEKKPAILTEENRKLVREGRKESMSHKKTEYMQSGNLGFDLALTDGKGIPIGSSILLWSNPGIGKSTLLSDICLRLLKQTENSETPFDILYIDTEGGAEQVINSMGLGEYIDSGRFLYIRQPLITWDLVSVYYECIFRNLEGYGNVKVVIIDSVTNVMSSANIEKTGSDGDFGSKAKERYFFYMKYLLQAKERNITSFFVSQARNNKDAGMFGDPDKAAVAKGDLHAVDIIMRCSQVKSKGDIKVTSKDTNFGSSVKTSERYILKMDSQSGSGKNRYWTGLPAETVLVKGKMCENTYTLRNILLGAGYIKQSGAWYSIDENICKALGIESSKKQITALNQLIKDNASTFFNILKESDDFHVVPKNAVETEVSADELEDEE